MTHSAIFILQGPSGSAESDYISPLADLVHSVSNYTAVTVAIFWIINTRSVSPFLHIQFKKKRLFMDSLNWDVECEQNAMKSFFFLVSS